MNPSRLDSTDNSRNRWPSEGWPSEGWPSEGWTGEHDSAAAIALAASLALGAFLFLILAAMQLG
jgi:hypothetical protein